MDPTLPASASPKHHVKRIKPTDETEYGFIEEGPDDELIPGQRFGLQVKLPALYDERSEFQRIQIFDTKAHGRAMVLDGVVQFTEFDEFAYHEMLVHVPLLSSLVAPVKDKRVLLVGAGDGGALREICKHSSVSHPTFTCVVCVLLTRRCTFSFKGFIDCACGDRW